MSKSACNYSNFWQGFKGFLGGVGQLFGVSSSQFSEQQNEFSQMEGDFGALKDAWQACYIACQVQLEGDMLKYVEASNDQLNAIDEYNFASLSDAVKINKVLAIAGIALGVLLLIFVLTQKTSPFAR